jgi:hypothetical protein
MYTTKCIKGIRLYVLKGIWHNALREYHILLKGIPQTVFKGIAQNVLKGIWHNILKEL